MGLYSLLPATCQLHASHTVPGKALLAVELLVMERYLTLSCLVLNKIAAEEQLEDSKRLSLPWFGTNSDMDCRRVLARRDPKIMGPNLFSV